MTGTTFAIRYARRAPTLFVLFGLGPAASGVDVTPEQVCVRMGWAFRADIPLRDVRHVEHEVSPLMLGWGVYGTVVRWLLNRSAEGRVRLTIHPPCRARLLGVISGLSTLQISLVDPDGFITTLHRARAA